MCVYLSVFLCLLSITHVFSLNCYTIRMPTTPSQAHPVLENCDKMKKDIENIQDVHFDYSSPSCFTMEFKIPNSDQQLIGKGCMPANGCEGMKRVWKAMMNSVQSQVPNIPNMGDLVEYNCNECKGNECNSASKILNFSLFGIFLTSFILMV